MDSMDRDPAKKDRIILTDALGEQRGTATKEEAHRQGLAHLAFSVLLYRDTPGGREYLLCRRAQGKYHSGGLWANSCCSHPREGEDLLDAAKRRVREELGCTLACPRKLGVFLYRAQFPGSICEYEYDHVLAGRMEGSLCPDPREVSAWEWVTAPEVNRRLLEAPETFAVWAFTVLSMGLGALEE